MSEMAAASGSWNSMMAATLSLLCRCMTIELASTTAKRRSSTADRMRILTRTVIVRPRYAGQAALSKAAGAFGPSRRPARGADRHAPDHERHRGEERGRERLAQRQGRGDDADDRHAEQAER